MTSEQGRRAGHPLPYALISRHGTPQTLGYYILHEGLIGVLGDQGLKEDTYAKIEKKKTRPSTSPMPGSASPTNTGRRRCSRHRRQAARRTFPSGASARSRPIRPIICSTPQTIAPGATGAANARLFAGAKEVAIVDGYDKALKLDRFELLIDWGWFSSSPSRCSSRWTGSSSWSAISASPSWS